MRRSISRIQRCNTENSITASNNGTGSGGPTTMRCEALSFHVDRPTDRARQMALMTLFELAQITLILESSDRLAMPMWVMKQVGATMAMEVPTLQLTWKGILSHLSKDNFFAQRLLACLSSPVFRQRQFKTLCLADYLLLHEYRAPAILMHFP